MGKRNYNIIFPYESPEEKASNEAKYGHYIPSENFIDGSEAPDAYKVPIEDKYILNGNTNWIFPENPTDDAIYKSDKTDDVNQKFMEFFRHYPPLEEDKQNIKNFLKNFINKNELDICDTIVINNLVIVTPEAELRNSVRCSMNPLLIYAITNDKNRDFIEDDNGKRISIEKQIPESERHKYQDTVEDIINELCKENININIQKELPTSFLLTHLQTRPPGYFGEDDTGGEEYRETLSKWNEQHKGKGGKSRKHNGNKSKKHKTKKHKSKKHKTKKHN